MQPAIIDVDSESLPMSAVAGRIFIVKLYTYVVIYLINLFILSDILSLYYLPLFFILKLVLVLLLFFLLLLLLLLSLSLFLVIVLYLSYYFYCIYYLMQTSLPTIQSSIVRKNRLLAGAAEEGGQEVEEGV